MICVGGKGDGPADASKVKAYGPGLEKNKVRPGIPANFTVDSSKTGPASIDVDLLGNGQLHKSKGLKVRFFTTVKVITVNFVIDANGRRLGEVPLVMPTEAAGVHSVEYVPPSEPDTPYKVKSDTQKS